MSLTASFASEQMMLLKRSQLS